MTEHAVPMPTVSVIEVASVEPEALFARGSRVEAALLGYVPEQRWFRSKARKPTGLGLTDAVALAGSELWLLFVEVSFSTGEPETYLLPLGIERGKRPPELTVVGARRGNAAAITWLVDASADARTARALHHLAVHAERRHGRSVELAGVSSSASCPEPSGSSRALSGEQSNSSFVLGREYAGKLLRRLEPGPSLEVEVLEHLGRSPVRAPVPTLVARVEATFTDGPNATIWLSESYIENGGDAFTTTVRAVVGYYERALGAGSPTLPVLPAPFLPRSALDVPDVLKGLFGEQLARLELLGKRTAELHRALAHDRNNRTFRPESPTKAFYRQLEASLRDLFARSFDKLEGAELAPGEAELRSRLLPRRGELFQRVKRALETPSAAPVMRVHGDYHLGQVLDTGTDLVIVDFDGEPARPREERARRRSPLFDVAGMLRSFHYAAFGALSGELFPTPIDRAYEAVLLPWAALHARWSSAAFLAVYLDAMADSGLLPPVASLAEELELHLVEKALYELGYELDFRPRAVGLPLRGLLELLGD